MGVSRVCPCTCSSRSSAPTAQLGAQTLPAETALLRHPPTPAQSLCHACFQTSEAALAVPGPVTSAVHAWGPISLPLAFWTLSRRQQLPKVWLPEQHTGVWGTRTGPSEVPGTVHHKKPTHGFQHFGRPQPHFYEVPDAPHIILSYVFERDRGTERQRFLFAGLFPKCLLQTGLGQPEARNSIQVSLGVAGTQPAKPPLLLPRERVSGKLETELGVEPRHPGVGWGIPR